jgi:hypothetical protein
MSERINIAKETLKDGTESITYSKSWEKNGMSCRKEVRKVEGGYIVTISKHGKPTDQGEDAEWIDERREFVTTENPFEEAMEEKKEEEKEEQKMFKFIDMPNLM